MLFSLLYNYFLLIYVILWLLSTKVQWASITLRVQAGNAIIVLMTYVSIEFTMMKDLTSEIYRMSINDHRQENSYFDCCKHKND